MEATQAAWPFGVGLFLYFSVSAFVISYLMTSRYLAGLLDKGTVRQLKENLARARVEAKSSLQLNKRLVIEEGAEADIKSGDLASEANLQQIAQQIDHLLRRKSSTERTRSITVQNALAMAVTRSQHGGKVEMDTLRELHASSPGGAITAMAAIRGSLKPQKEAFDLVMTSIEESQTAFEQYEALKALENLSRVLDDAEKTRACNAMKTQRSGGEGNWIHEGTDRWALSRVVGLSLGCPEWESLLN